MKRLILLILFSFSILNATDYFIKAGGSDALSGTSDENAWKTIAKINNTAFSAGDRIYLNRGDSFYGELSHNLTGTVTDTIRIGAYGTGAKPIIYGDLTGATWTKVEDSVWSCHAPECYYNDAAGYTWQDSAGSRVPVYKFPGKFKGEGGAPDYIPLTRAQTITALKSYPWSMVAGVWGQDSVFIKTWDGLTPKCRVFHANYILGAYVIVENIDFRNYWTGLAIYNANHMLIQYNSMQNIMGQAIIFNLTKNSRSQYNRIDTTNYTAQYSYKSARVTFYRDTVKNVKSNILYITRAGSEQCGLGAQEDTSIVFDGCYYYNILDYGVDTYMNVGDTVRNCTFVNVKGGMQVYNGSWTIHNNSIALNGDGHGIRGLLYGTGLTRIYNNTITNLTTGNGLESGGTGTTTVEWTGNIVQGTNASGSFCYFPTSGVTSTNNNFCGDGKWRRSTTDYATLTLFQATGYEASSSYSESCASNPVLSLSSGSHSFGNLLVNTTSAEWTYTISGSDLSPTSGDVTITASTGFEVSKTTSSGFGSEITCAYTDGTLATTTIYVRFKPTIVTSYSGSVTNTVGATEQIVSLAGISYNRYVLLVK